MFSFPHPLPIFAATRPDQIPPGIARFIAVDGTVPGAALTWDHHRSGEPINLDAMPGAFDPSGYDAVATTSPDTDAAASALAVMAGGKDRLPPGARRVLEAASWRCDHLRAQPGADPEDDRRGDRLHAWVCRELADPRYPDRGAAFAAVCLDLMGRISRGEALPGADPVLPGQAESVARARAERIRIEGEAAVLDMRGLEAVPIQLLYAAMPEVRAAAFAGEHERGGWRYTVGINPAHPAPLTDLGPLLRALAADEFALGPPARSPDPLPGAENWGGRATVFGSPWNYGSRLPPERVLERIAAFCREAGGGGAG